ncbi:MAG: hypothetical protein GEU96_21685, partial [Propionibacteriales bacterium]|nr:hypothetical protein [Propionibacteriales bacterium]
MLVRRAVAPAGALLLALAACTTSAGGERAADPSVQASASTEPAPSAEPAPTQPLVLVIHATRPPVNVTEQVARRVIAGRVDSWADLGASARPLRTVESVRDVTRDRDALAVLPAAEIGPSVQA